MSEPEQASGATPKMSRPHMAGQGAWFFHWLREGADKAMDAFAPPSGVAKHFREARLEVLRGIRELIDYRIEQLSKTDSKGGRIVVE